MAPLMLLAKSPKEGRSPKTLAEHSCDVMDAFEALFGEHGRPTRLGREWLRFFQLLEEDYPAFHANGLATCGLHDLGKANDGFQNAVSGRGEQLLRHEHLSGLILALSEVRKWLEMCVDSDIVLSAVVGHHLKASGSDELRYPAFAQAVSATGQSLVLHADHDEFRSCLDAVADRLGMSRCTATLPAHWQLHEGAGQSIEEARQSVEQHFNARAQRQLKSKAVRRRHQLLMAVKAAVVVSDAAGSGLVREEITLREWLRDVFALTLGVEDIDQHIIKKRIQAIEARTGKRFIFQDFQEQAARMPRRALLLAPCGVGKTIAAWRWIEARLKERPCGRVLFLYPTRATATEGFRDYVSFAPESDAALLSGTARYELQDMFANPIDERYYRDYLTEERLYALGFWQKRVFSATVDQFFAFLQQGYSGICLLPVLADSVVVVDEIHSFDVGLFSALRRLLERFDLPVLCMTASLPAHRREALQKLGLEVFPKSGELDDVERRARMARYRVEELDSPETAARTARDALGRDQRVLWVVNTVDRCQALARSFEDIGPLCYHSRFTLEDRKERHKRVVEVFQSPTSGGVLAITTQVCEMSLDLDAQVLISETAPIPALIQRMGRCNRHSLEPDSPLGEVYVYEPERSAPYGQDEVTMGQSFVRELKGRRVSQADLEELLERYTATQEAEGERLIAFIEDGFWSRGGAEELRDGEDYTVPAVLDTEVEEYLAIRKNGQPVDGFIVPVPRRFAQRDSRLPGFLYVAPGSHYTAELGFLKEMPERKRAVIL